MRRFQQALPVGARAWLERRLVRLLTYAAARAPWAWEWEALSGAMRGVFDPLAPAYDRRVAGRTERWLAPLEAALDELACAPRRALDVGTGTGLAVELIATRYPKTEVTGVDVSEGMIAEARSRRPRLPNGHWVAADGRRLPFNDFGFDLVTCVNAPPFFGELARVTAVGGAVVVAFSLGERTPIYLPTREVERRLRAHGFGSVRSGRAGAGVWTLGKKLQEISDTRSP
jgi:SAM-dependent methyltransferase